MNIPVTFEVRNLLALHVHGLIGEGRGGGVATSQKLVRSLAMPTLSIPSPRKKILCLPYRLFISVHSFSRVSRFCSFEWGLRTPNLGEGEAVGGRGWHRSKERW